MDDIFQKQATSLEEEFFRRRDMELVKTMREKATVAAQRKALMDVSGIKDETVIDQLIAHNIHPETLAALALAPVIAVVWADGEVDAQEIRVVMKAVEKHGVAKDSTAFRLVEEWLKVKPKTNLLNVWKEYVKSLCGILSPEAREELKQNVLGAARAAAEAAGGFLGIGRTSSEEESVLADIESAFRVPRGK